MPLNREDWFPTPIWYFDVENAGAIEREVLPFLDEERRRDPEGMVNRSSVNGWHSRDDLQREPAFRQFLAILEQNVMEVVRFASWDLTRVEPQLTNCWATVNDPGASNARHTHGQSHLSGVYWITAPQDCGDVVFHDPREVAWVFAPPVTRYDAWSFQTATYSPISGRMLVFPSWLHHEVMPNRSLEARTSLSFNVLARPR